MVRAARKLAGAPPGWAAMVGNNVLKIGADGTVIIPVDHRSPVVNVTTLEMLMKLSSANSDTKLYIRLVDENMEDIFAVALTGNKAGLIMR